MSVNILCHYASFLPVQRSSSGKSIVQADWLTDWLIEWLSPTIRLSGLLLLFKMTKRLRDIRCSTCARPVYYCHISIRGFLTTLEPHGKDPRNKLRQANLDYSSNLIAIWRVNLSAINMSTITQTSALLVRTSPSFRFFSTVAFHTMDTKSVATLLRDVYINRVSDHLLWSPSIVC